MRLINWLMIGFLLSLLFLITGQIWLMVLICTVVFFFLRKYLLIFLFLIGVFGGWLRLEYWDYQLGNLRLYPETNVIVIGRVCREIDYRRNDVRYTVCLEKDQSLGINVRGKILVVADLYPKFKYGDRLRLSGKLLKPKKVEDFAYDLYLERYGITRIMYRPKVYLLNSSYGGLNLIYSIKAKILKRLNLVYQEPAASLLAGLLVGYRGGLADELLESFRITGLTHIIAVSGSNVALFLLVLERPLLFVPKKVRLGLLVLGLLGFCIFTGASASVIRATIMGALMLIARYFGRQKSVVFILLITAFVMSLFTPLLIVYDGGFQLSFLAVIGILLFGDFFASRFKFLQKFPVVKESLVMTLAAQLGTLPLSIFLFGVFPLSSVVVNVMVAPLLPIIMALGVFGALLGFRSIVSLLIEVFVLIVDFWAGFDFLLLEFTKAEATYLAIGILLIMLLILFLFFQGSRKHVVGEDV